MGATAPVVRVGDPTGPYRRRIRLLAIEPGVVWGGLEDDFHHFEVTLRHDSATVTHLEMHPVRWPWLTCPDAGVALRALEGMALSERCTAAAAVADPRQNCTHQFDLAGLCVAHAARGISRRQYDVEVPPPVEGVLRPSLRRDGDLLLEWELRVGRSRTRELVAPARFTAAPWKGGFMKWADANLAPDDAEAAIVLRRSCDIGMGRGMDLEAIDCAQELAGIMTGICYTMQPETMPVALRERGTIRDFGRDPDALLSGRPGATAAG